MRSLRIALAAIGLVASTAFASPADPKLGAEYIALANPQPVQTVGKKVEVVEFFMYHCPACNSLEPHIAEWVKKQGDNIVFRRVHLPYSGAADPEAHLYLTLESMGRLGDMHNKVFRAIHVERVRMNRDDVVIDWASKNGVDKAKFLEHWNSFNVMTKLKRLPSVINNYKVESVPTIVVDGKYLTSPSVVDAANPGMGAGVTKATLQVLDGMVAKVAKTK